MKQVKPTKQNSFILGQTIQAKVNKSLKTRFPTAEDIVGDILKEPKRSLWKK